MAKIKNPFKDLSIFERVLYICPKCGLSEFESRLGFYSCTVSVFEQYVLAELIRGGDFERHIHRVRRKRRRQL